MAGDIVFTKNAGSTTYVKNIRLEERSQYSLTGSPSIQIGTAGSPTLSIGDTYTRITNKLWVGQQAETNTSPPESMRCCGD